MNESDLLERLGRPVCGWCGAPRPSVSWDRPQSHWAAVDMTVCVSCDDPETRPAMPCIICTKRVTTMDIDGNPWCGDQCFSIDPK